MKLYKVGGYKSLIEEVEVLRANEKSIWEIVERWGKTKEERSARHTTYTHYFDTIEEAKAFLSEKLNREVEAAKSRIGKWEAQLKELSEY